MLAVLTVINICNVIDRTLIGILVPDIKAELQLSDFQIGLLTGPAFAIFYAIMGLPLGWLSERVSRTRLIAVALLVWSAMTGLSGLATSFGYLLLFRILVAFGEAGGSPPSYAMISDAYAPRYRTIAMGVFTGAAGVGGFVGLFGGGWINEFWGWRATYIIAGLFGLLFVPLILFTVRDPVSGAADNALRPAPLPMREILGRLAANKTFPNLAAAATLSAFAAFTFLIWLPSFLHRSYGLGSGDVGTILGTVKVVGGLAGTMGGAEIARRLGSRDLRWWLWVPAIGFLTGAPAAMAGLFATELWLSTAFIFITFMTMSTFTGVLFAALGTITSPGMRGVASSSLLFIQMTLGLGLGPVLTGFVSDYLTTRYGQEGLRYALFVPAIALIWGSAHYFLAARTIRLDASRALGDLPQIHSKSARFGL